MKDKLLDLCHLYEKINEGANTRANKLEDTLEVGDRFWDDLHNLSRTLKDLQDSLINQEPPALEPSLIREQQDNLEVMVSKINFICGVCFWKQSGKQNRGLEHQFEPL